MHKPEFLNRRPARWVGRVMAVVGVGAFAVYFTAEPYGPTVRLIVGGISAASVAVILAANLWLRPRVGLSTAAVAVVAGWALLGPLLPLLSSGCDDGRCTAPQLASWVVTGGVWGMLTILFAATCIAFRNMARMGRRMSGHAVRFARGRRVEDNEGAVRAQDAKSSRDSEQTNPSEKARTKPAGTKTGKPAGGGAGKVSNGTKKAKESRR